MNLIIYPVKSPIAFHLFDYPIRYYGLIMSIVFILGVFLAYQLFSIKKLEKDKEYFLDYSPVVILFSLIGARLFYVFGSLDFYLKNPLEILMINHGGQTIFGAIVFGLISLFICSKKYNFSFFEHCDILAVIFPICQSIGRFGNYFNQEAYGKPANGFLRLYVDEMYRKDEFLNVNYYHPTFLYESLLDLVVFLILLFLFFKKTNLKSGTLFFIYFLFYGLIRLFVEEIRIDSVLNIGNFHIAQIISILFIFVGITGLFYLNKKRT